MNKHSIFFFLISTSIWLSINAHADELAKWGGVSLSAEEYITFLERIPEDQRAIFLANQTRVSDSLENILLNKLLFEKALSTGIDQQPDVLEKIEASRRNIILTEMRKSVLDAVDNSDYEQLAYEQYLANEENYIQESTRDVTHLLISTSEREEQAALSLVSDLYDQIIADPSVFEELVLEYSEDPSATSNKGAFLDVERGRMVPEFEKTLFEFAEAGQISKPVRTQFGYHILRLDRVNAPKKLAFDEIKDELIKGLSRSKREAYWKQYIRQLRPAEAPEFSAAELQKVLEAAAAQATGS